MDESDAEAPSPVPLQSHIAENVKGHTSRARYGFYTGVIRHGFFAKIKSYYLEESKPKWKTTRL